MKRLLRITLLLPLLLAATGCDRAEPVSDSGVVVKVGFVGALQGPDAPRGEDTLEGVMTAHALQPLLINGDRVEIITADSGDDPEMTRSAMRRLVAEDGVVALLLALDSEALLEVAAFADTLGAPLIALIASHPDIVADSDYIAQLPFDDTTQSTVAALFVRDELLIKRAAVIANFDNPHSRYLKEIFERKFIATGGELTGSHAVADISDELLLHLQARDTELLYLPLSAQAALRVVSVLGEIGWDPEIMTSDGLLASIQGAYPDRVDELEGVYATDLFSDTGEFVKHRRLGRQAEVSFGDLFDSRKNTFTGLGVEGYALLVDAINRCASSSDRECVNTAIRSTERFEGTMARISIDEHGRAYRPVYVNTIRGGLLESVVKVY
jgi:branched-chain amino acid transport system substrate-binding protein